MKQRLYQLFVNSKILAPVRSLRRFLVKKRFERNLRQKTRELHQQFEHIAFIMATPCHGNLGDHAIVYAETQLLKQCGFSDNVIEISNSEYQRYRDVICKYVGINDIIIIDGGGNLGTLWPEEDQKISEMIGMYRKNKIIVFPQTCYYDNSSLGQQRLEHNRQVYAKAKQLTIMLRDFSSYEYCCKNFPDTKLLYVPDIVLSIEYQEKNQRDSVCMICFRKDLERTLSSEQQESIFAELKNHQIAAKEFSTIYPGSVNANQREQLLTELWSEIGSAKLVITDRLHAMIFAVITGTPCLALDNKSKKVSGVYQWISKLPYVKVCATVDEMLEEILPFYNQQAYNYPMDLLEQEFVKIAKIFASKE